MLSLAESAYLAALPQAPTYYNPLGPNRKSLDNRKNSILELMRQQGYITEQQAKDAQGQAVTFNPLSSGIKAPHFVFYVQDYLANKYGELSLEEGGLKVYTTLDPALQTIAEEAIKNQSEKNAKNYNAHT
jgi:penicillin-binding protein 1A